MGLLEVLIALFAIGTPLALYFVMARGHKVHEAARGPTGPDLSQPPPDFGLSNDAHTVPAGRGDREDSASQATSTSTAAAAGGALVLGWDVAHRDSGHGSESGRDAPTAKGEAGKDGADK